MKRRIAIIAALAALAAVAVVHADKSKDQMKMDMDLESATFAGGCFWCMEPPFDAIDGVVATISGYTGGFKDDPTYKEVSSGSTGHAEALQVVYDPKKVTYSQLLEVYWHNIDPTTPDRQFCDGGTQYRPGIFYNSDEQKRLAEASRDAVIASGHFKNVAVEITELTEFYPAEEYHQDFYKKDPERYYSYRKGCRRDARLEQLWGDYPGKIATP